MSITIEKSLQNTCQMLKDNYEHIQMIENNPTLQKNQKLDEVSSVLRNIINELKMKGWKDLTINHAEFSFIDTLESSISKFSVRCLYDDIDSVKSKIENKIKNLNKYRIVLKTSRIKNTRKSEVKQANLDVDLIENLSSNILKTRNQFRGLTNEVIQQISRVNESLQSIEEDTQKLKEESLKCRENTLQASSQFVEFNQNLDHVVHSVDNLAQQEKLFKQSVGLLEQNNNNLKLEVLRARERVTQLSENARRVGNFSRLKTLLSNENSFNFIYEIFNNFDSLKKDLDEAEYQSRASGGTLLKKEVKDKLVMAQRNFYSAILLQIIEKIGEKQREKKLDKTTLEIVERLNQEIQELDDYFANYIEKYEKVYFERVSLENPLSFDNLCKASLNISKDLLKRWKRPIPRVLKHRKHCADLGYSMIEQINNLFCGIQEVPIDGDNGWEAIIKKQIEEFNEWAYKHPLTASHMAGDIATAYSILIGDGLFESVYKRLSTVVYTHTYLNALGSCVEEPFEGEKELKFRALADFASELPVCIAMGKTVDKLINYEFKSFSVAIYDMTKHVLKCVVPEKIVSIIPPDAMIYAKFATDIIQGKDLAKILAQQRNLALLALAGELGKGQWKISDLKIWWNTIWKSQGNERWARLKVQILIPFGGAAFGMAVIVSAYCGVIFSIGMALSLAMIVLSGSIIHSYKKYQDYKIKFRDTYNKVFAEYMKDSKPDIQLEVKKEANEYIQELKKRDILFLNQQNIELSAHLENFASDLKQTWLLNLNEVQFELYTDGDTLTQDLIIHFNSTIKKMREDFTSENSPTLTRSEVEKIIVSVTDRLIEDWLNPRIQLAFDQKLVEMYDRGQQEECSIRPEDYIRKLMKKYTDESQHIDKVIEIFNRNV